MPITLPSGTGTGAQPASKAETYMVCLECGRHLAYDWGEELNRTGGVRTSQSGTAARDRSEKSP